MIINHNNPHLHQQNNKRSSKRKASQYSDYNGSRKYLIGHSPVLSPKHKKNKVVQPNGGAVAGSVNNKNVATLDQSKDVNSFTGKIMKTPNNNTAGLALGLTGILAESNSNADAANYVVPSSLHATTAPCVE